MRAKDYGELLRTGRWFRGIGRDFQDDLLGAASVRRLADRQLLFARGDPPSGIYAVVGGAVRVGGTMPSGKEAVLARLEPPSWFGEISAFDGLPRTHDAAADGETTLLEIGEERLQALLAQRPERWRALGQLMAHQVRLSFLALEELALLSPSERLVRRLLMIARGYGDWHQHQRRVIEVSQEELASMLGLSRQTTNQLLKELEAQGLVRLRYGEVELIDTQALEARAGAS